MLAEGPELLEVVRELTLVPGDEDGLDVGEILVERGTTDSGAFGDARHGECEWTLLGDEVGGRGEDGVVHLLAVRVDRGCPDPWHCAFRRSDCRSRHIIPDLGDAQMDGSE